MNEDRFVRFCIPFVCTLVLQLGAFSGLGAEAGTVAHDICSDRDIRNGLWVQLGVNDGALTTALSLDGKNTVQGLSDDQDRIERARNHIMELGLYGTVSVDVCNWMNLPYSTNTVNMVVVENYRALAQKGLNISEIVRVLCPRGVALIGGAKDAPGIMPGAAIEDVLERRTVNIGGRPWVKLIKAPDRKTGEWQQYFCNARRTCASRDAVAGPPKGVRWLAGKPWNNYAAKGSSMVSANGRCFYRLLPRDKSRKGKIIARDAYNGALLWQKDAEQMPQMASFVAVGERLYTYLDKRVVALDAVTGKQVLDFKAGTSGLTYHNGILVFGPRPGVWGKGTHTAYSAETAEKLWQDDTLGRGPTVAVEDRLYFLNRTARLEPSTAVVCLDIKTGKRIWEQAVTGTSLSWGDGKLFVIRGVIPTREKTGNIVVHALNAEDGRLLWDRKFTETKILHRGSFFAAGLVWVTTDYNELVGLDPGNGDVKKEFTYDVTMRGRCSSLSATERYIVHQNMSMVGLDRGRYHDFFGARGHCGTRIIPAHGLLYHMPDNCACYPKINGLAAFAPSSASSQTPGEEKKESRLLKGPVFGRKEQSASAGSSDWPSFRCNGKRSGSNSSSLGGKLDEKWRSDFNEEVTSPVVSSGLVFVALPSSHRIVALDAKTGDRKWTFVAGGRVDSPPTIHNGRAIFGSRDGYVYAVSAADGKLAWKFRAAPAERRILVNGQLESVWPVHGSVLVEGSTLYFCAGRHTDTDGGLYLYAVNPETGILKWEKGVVRGIFEKDPKRFRTPKVINDILSTDGKLVYLSSSQFDLETGDVVNRPAGSRIFCRPFGFLHDPLHGKYVEKGHDEGLHRIHAVKRIWLYTPHTTFSPGIPFQAAGQNLSISGSTVYGIFRRIDHRTDGKKTIGVTHYAFCDELDSAKGKGRKWKKDLAFSTAALVKAGNHVAVAGYRGATSEGLISVLRADTGETVGETTVDGHPIHCGLAPAGGSLYVSLQEGRILCLH